MEQLASLLLHSRTQAHSFHLGVKGVGAFSTHSALQLYYLNIASLVDGLVEAYQGQYGLIKLQPVSGLDTNNDIKNVIAYFDNSEHIVSGNIVYENFQNNHFHTKN